MAKRRRDAEYRERKRLKKLGSQDFKLEQSSPHIPVSRSSSYHDDSNSIISDNTPCRQKYFTPEERLAAKRRRDAEYRKRQRLKKLQVEASGFKPEASGSSRRLL